MDSNNNIYQQLKSSNYFSNCYRYLIKSKVIHFFLIIIEFLLNIIQELDLIFRDFSKNKREQETNKLFFIQKLLTIINKLPKIYIIIIIVIFEIILYLLYLLLRKNNFFIKIIYITIIVNILELIIFRLFMLFFFDLLFILKNLYLLFSIIIILPHIYLIMNNYFYNHLYYFVPIFIDYPYDEFSSLFDIAMFIIKIILSISYSIENIELAKFFFIILFIIQIFFSIFFIHKLLNHSYLFMKNSFLNRTRLCIIEIQTIIIFFALLIGEDDINRIFFIIVSFCFSFIILIYIYFIYNPFPYIKIEKETPMENIFFYLYILSDKNEINFIFEKKVNEHYEKCGICNLCKKYSNYLDKYEKFKKIIIEENEEKEKLINKVQENLINNKNNFIDLFYIVSIPGNNYFKLLNDMVINYKQNQKSFLNNYAHYYINLSFLIFSDVKQDNITLILNEKLILDFLNKENHSLIDNNQGHINCLLLYNEFINLSNTVINQLKEILYSKHNINKAKQLIDLSYQLKEMKDNKYEKKLFSSKIDNYSKQRNLITICSIIYEEIFNTTINNSQIPLRDNILQLEDIFHKTSNKNDKIISLSVNINNKKCKIIRAGKDLFNYLNNNLYDLFPLIFQEYQINLFLSSILTNFDNKLKINEQNNDSLYIINNKNKNFFNVEEKNINNKSIQYNNKKNKNNKIYIEIKIFLCINISSKVYYKLFNLKLKPLFHNFNNEFILFDGLYYFHQYSIITLIDKSKNNKEIIFGVSEPNLEKNKDIYSMPFKTFKVWITNNGYKISKISSINISFKLFNIYELIPKYNIIKVKTNLKKSNILEKKKKMKNQKIILSI